MNEKSINRNLQIFPIVFAYAGGSLKDPEINGNASVREEMSGAEPIIVRIVLKMSEFDHKVWGCFYALLWFSLYYNVTSARIL